MKSGKYKGIYKTNSNGNNPGTPNCFMFPLDKSGWRGFRFSPGVAETETWNQDKKGWTNCYFNCQPNLKTAAKAMGAQEDPDRDGFVFNSVAAAKKAAEALGQKINVKDYKRKARPSKRQPPGLDRPGNHGPPGRLSRTDPDRRGAAEFGLTAFGRGAADKKSAARA